MTNVHDVARYILDHISSSSTSTMKLQKLAFFSQGWSLAILGEPLFTEEFRAWKNGPVCYELFNRHRGQYSVDSWDGDPTALSKAQRLIVDATLSNYGTLSGLQLSELTHKKGTPWALARERVGAEEGAPANVVIDKDEISTYFRGALGKEARRGRHL
jgi:uncharacterized phage-associated protein